MKKVILLALVVILACSLMGMTSRPSIQVCQHGAVDCYDTLPIHPYTFLPIVISS
jgi:hypothetical protein